MNTPSNKKKNYKSPQLEISFIMGKEVLQIASPGGTMDDLEEGANIRSNWESFNEIVF